MKLLDVSEKDCGMKNSLNFEVIDSHIMVKGLSLDEIDCLGELCSMKVIGTTVSVAWYNLTELFNKLKDIGYHTADIADYYSENFINIIMEREKNIDRLKNDNSSFSLKNVSFFNGELYEVQKRGVLSLLMNRVWGLWFEMGMGKTVQVIYAYKMLLDHIENCRCLVISPNTVTYEWKLMFEKFINEEAHEVTKDSYLDDKKIVIVNYEKLIDRKVPKKDEVIESEVMKKLSKQKFDVIVIDESHFIKNISSKRTRAVIKLIRGKLRNYKSFNIGKVSSKSIYSSGKFPHIWFLSGTPMEEVLDIYVFLRRAFGVNFIKYSDFKEYFLEWKEIYIKNGRKLRVPDCVKNEEELSRLLNKTSIRKDRSSIREIKSVDKVIHINMSDDMLREYNKIINNEDDTILERIINGIMFCNNPSLVGIDKLASEKYNALVDIINGTKEKILVWTIFRDSADMLKSSLDKEKIKSVVFKGGSDDKEVRRKFEGDYKVLISTLAKGSIGVNFMKEAGTVVYLDRPFSYAQWIQSKDRVMRVDRVNTKPVLFIDLKMKIEGTSVEEMVDEVIERKINLNQLIKEQGNLLLQKKNKTLGNNEKK